MTMGGHIKRPLLVAALSVLELVAFAINFYFTIMLMSTGFGDHVHVGVFTMRVILLSLAMPRLILSGEFAEDPVTKSDGLPLNAVTVSKQVRRLSIEGLAVELNLPTLIKLSGKVSAQQLASMKYAEVNELCAMTPEDFIKLKQATK